jgi:ABC-2 type transport system ATP-binding protein
LSTHILPEVSMVCDRAIIIHNGRIMAEDRIENLSRLSGDSARMRLWVQGPAGAITAALERVAGILSVFYEAPYHTVEFQPGGAPHAALVEAVQQGGWTLQAMEAVETSLEDVFLQVTAAKETVR